MNPDDPLGLIAASTQDPLGLMKPPQAKPAVVPPVDKTGDISEFVAKHILNAAQGIPGMEAFEAGAGALGSKLTDHPMSYKESLETLRGATDSIGGVTSAIEKAVGTAPLLPFLPASPALAGALLGGGDQLLNADSNQSLLERGTRTALGAAGGAAIGKTADMAVMGARAAVPAFLGGPGKVATNLLDRAAARAQSAKQLYGAALAEGKANASGTPPQAILDYLKEPDIQDIVKSLQETREFKNVSADSPEMLDAIYKTLSDRGAQVRKGLLAVNPSKPNIGRYQSRDIAAAQAAGLSAIDEVMPTYRGAVKDFAQHKAAEDAVARGYDAVRTGLLGNLPSARNLTRTTPEAFKKWAETAGPDETRAAAEGVLGATKALLYKKPLTMGRKAVALSPSLLRATGDATAKYVPRAGLLATRWAY